MRKLLSHDNSKNICLNRLDKNHSKDYFRNYKKLLTILCLFILWNSILVFSVIKETKLQRNKEARYTESFAWISFENYTNSPAVLPFFTRVYISD